MKIRSIKNNNQAGFSLLEVLITLLIVLIGLLGIVALQVKAQIAELESYQRAQALILLSDIVDRMNANRSTISCFDITTNTTAGTPFIGATGTGHLGTPTCTASTTAYNTQAVNAITDLDNLLQGSSETIGTDLVGAMTGARACINYDASTEVGGKTGTGLYTIIITWQGLDDLVAPQAGLECAVGLYGAATKRRAVSTRFRIASLF